MKYTNVTEGEFVCRNNRFYSGSADWGSSGNGSCEKHGAYEGVVISRSQGNADLFR